MNDYSQLSNNELNKRIGSALNRAIYCINGIAIYDYTNNEDNWKDTVNSLTSNRITALYASLYLRGSSLYAENKVRSPLHSLKLSETPLGYTVVYLMLLPTRIKAEALLAVLEDEDAV